MTSQDVLHSFFVPAFRVKQDLVPGMETYLWFETDEPGTYDVLCAEYCGNDTPTCCPRSLPCPRRSSTPGTGRPIRATRVSSYCRSRGVPRATASTVRSSWGPRFQGIFGRQEVVVTTSGEEREVAVDEEYLRRSILEPAAEIVKGYPPSMPPQGGNLSDQELDAIVDFLKTLE